MNAADPYPHLYARVAAEDVYVLKFDEPEQVVQATVLRLGDVTCDRCAMEWREAQMPASSYRRVPSESAQ